MRISDWSSDVCSSDLIDRVLGGGFGALKGLIVASLLFLAVNLGYEMLWGNDEPRPDWIEAGRTYPLLKLSSDRKSVVSGKRVSVRVALGGRRIIKKKKV